MRRFSVCCGRKARCGVNSKTGLTYEALEQTAVLTGMLPSGANRLAVSQVWIQHPHGFYVRYLPQGYQRTTLQIYVPQAAAASPAPLVFDPSEEIATPASTGRQRLGITARESDAGPTELTSRVPKSTLAGLKSPDSGLT